MYKINVAQEEDQIYVFTQQQQKTFINKPNMTCKSRPLYSAQWRGCGGSVVERQATNPVVPSSNPGQSLQYHKISWVL